MGKIVKGTNDLATLFPDVAKQWDYEKNAPKRPEDFAAFSNKKMHWKCPKCDMSYPARISDRTAKNSGCPYCAGKIPIVGKNDLKSQFPLRNKKRGIVVII